MTQKLEKTKRSEPEKRAQKKYMQKCFQFKVAINREVYPKEVAYLQNLKDRPSWLCQKVREDLDREK